MSSELYLRSRKSLFKGIFSKSVTDKICHLVRRPNFIQIIRRLP